ncbi:SipW-dependent-type signal peptide-containing protein [Cellulomonas sp.]|uniref:SipW-dependent-type signal peptide-containing protein n=1 Tax=Cellulomonas sp. TaxID=40001 RepID=UPI0028124C74|nr:SipW-dependent-type signal peptide-containing protein [Cellulomonas sp.]
MMDEVLEEMIDPAPPREEVLRRRRLWTTGAILGMAALGATSLTTAAVFTDRDTTEGGITTGTLVLETAETLEFTLPEGNLAPGDTTYAPMQLANGGSLALRYALSLVSEAEPGPGGGDLRDRLRLDVYQGVTPEACRALDTGSTPPADRVGGWPRDAATFGLPTTLTPVVGDPSRGDDPTEGAEPGDRTLIAGQGETLCLALTMQKADDDSDNPFQGTSATVRFQVDSEQTVNNS